VRRVRHSPSLVLGAAGALFLGLSMTLPAVGSPSDAMSFVDLTQLDIGFDTPTAKPTTLVALANSGAARSALVFNVLVQQDGKAVTDAIKVSADTTSIDANQVAWITLTFERTADATALSGSLVASAEGVAPAVRPITIDLGQRVITFRGSTLTIASTALPGGPGGVVLLGFVISLLLVLGRAFAGKFEFADKIGSPKWSFDSWTTNVTAVGALLGTALGAGFFSATPTLLTTGQFSGLNVLAGALLLVGPLVYVTVGHADGTHNGAPFLIAALIAFTAAFTELMTLLVALADSTASIASGVMSTLLLLICAASIVLICFYGWKAMGMAFKGGSPNLAGSRSVPSGRDDGPANWTLF
jgi:hypothetical protein